MTDDATNDAVSTPEGPPAEVEPIPAPKRSASPIALKLRRFRRLRRGYFSFLVLTIAYVGSFLLPFLMSNRALVVRYEGSFYFPAARSFLHQTFGYYKSLGFFEDAVYAPATFGVDSVATSTDYRLLEKRFAEQDSGNFVWMPLLPYDPTEQFLDEGALREPDSEHWMGTDDRGRDVLVRLAYGFRISMSFALLVTMIAYLVGTLIGATLGYFSGWIDLVGQRLVEIWGGIPFLYTVIIISAAMGPSFFMLVLVLAAFGWIGISYYIRGEFYREKARDYVAAAIATGEGNFTIMLRHVLPNALTPIIAFAPFAIVANITTLVALDFLGFGLPAPTPSWGELMKQGRANIREWHLVVFPLLAMFTTLQLIVFIGEAVREAFDPKVFSRMK